MQPLINIGNSFIWSKCKETGVTIYDAENDILFRLFSSFWWAALAFSIVLEEFISLLMFALTYVCHLPYSMGHLLVLLITSVRVPLIVYLSLDQYWNVHFNACWQLGLAEKNILNYDFDLVASDPSDANTNSTTLFSDDTDDRSCRSTNPEMGLSVHQEDEVSVV